MNIYEKMSNITNEIEKVNKNLTVGEGKSSYKAVGEADVLKAVKELEFKYKIYSYPYAREIIESSMYTTSNQYGEKNNIFSRIKTTYRFVNIENPDEYIDTITYAEGIDTQDKGAGKAMTYCDKYALMKVYKIITGDDPDQSASPEGQKIKSKKIEKEEITEIIDINMKVGFGKYKDKSWLEVYNENSKYFDWLIDNAKTKEGAETYKKIREEIENSFIKIDDDIDTNDIHRYDGQL